MITDRFQQAGSFELRLKEGTPLEIRTQLSEFAAVFLTDSPLPSGVIDTTTELRAVARWSGVVEEVPDSGFTLRGWGPRWLLGGGRFAHAGHALPTVQAFTATALDSALGTLLPSTEPIHVGACPTTAITASLPATTARGDAVEQLIAQAGHEWRVNPDFTIDVGDALFATTPTVILLSHPGSSATGTLVGVDARTMRAGRDATTYASEVFVVARSGDTDVAVVGSDSKTAEYTDVWGNDLTIARVVDAPTVPGPSADTVAAGVLNLATVRTTVELAAIEPNPRRLMEPGDYLYAFAPDAGLIDTAEQEVYDGEVISPVVVRLQAMSWGFTAGMGCYVRTSAATLLDLTDWVVHEGDSVVLEVGRGTTTDSDLATFGTLGGGMDATARLAGVAPMGAWTPVVDATPTDPTLSTAVGHYRIEGGMCFAGFRCVVSANGSGTYTITGLPVLPVAGRATFVADGGGRLVDASSGNVQQVQLVVNDSGVITMRYVASATPGAEVQPTNTLPWTWASGDSLEGAVFYPIR